MNERGPTEAPVVLTFSGDGPAELAAALERAAAASGGARDADLSEPRHKTRLRVIVTGARTPAAFADGVSYAAGEVRAGIAAAGGHVGGGTHVEIQWLNMP
ncbi:MAG: hypothetical protein HY928_05845 [Elusimicrobia bacterium]|nr:hypothetical protein [Elusimicrobiota bacterium]